MHRRNKYSQRSSIIKPLWLNGWVFIYELTSWWFESSWSHLNLRFHNTWHDQNIQSNAPLAATLTWDFAPSQTDVFLDIEVVIERGVTPKRVLEMIRTYIQMYHTHKYSHYSPIIWPVWLNGWVFVYLLTSCVFECSCSHLNFTSRVPEARRFLTLGEV